MILLSVIFRRKEDLGKNEAVKNQKPTLEGGRIGEGESRGAELFFQCV